MLSGSFHRGDCRQHVPPRPRIALICINESPTRGSSPTTAASDRFESRPLREERIAVDLEMPCFLLTARAAPKRTLPRHLGADEDEDRFRDKLRVIAWQKPKDEPKPKKDS